MKKFYIPLVVLGLFILESLFVNILSAQLFHSERIYVPRFLIIFFTFFAVYGNNRSAIWYSMVVGLLFDIVYTEILGIYMFVFPVVTYLVCKAMKILQNNIFMVSVIALVAIALTEVIVYFVNAILGFAPMSLQVFSTIRLLPTLLLNLVAIIIFAYPFKQVIVKYSTEDSKDVLFRKRS
ncbi:MAG: rod shape-determining protein MreD [Bacillus sp. (in: firmicutes)]